MKRFLTSMGGLLLAGLAAACGPLEHESAGEPALDRSLETRTAALAVSCGDNVALGASATSSGWYADGAPAWAVDGDPNTAWRSNLSNGAWLQVDLGTTRTLSRAIVTWAWDDSFGTSAESVLEGSQDGVSWTPLKTLTLGPASNDTPQDVLFPAISARYVRFRAVQWNGGRGHVKELQLYENLALGRPATASGWSGSDGAPARAVDGNLNTYWRSNSSTGAWVRVDLGAPHDLTRAVVRWGWDTRYGTSADSVLEGSLDGTSWMLMKKLTYTLADNGSLQDVSFPAISARYVRLRATRWNGGWGVVHELQLYGQGVCSASANTASYAAALQVPKCSGSFSSCDSGSLLTGRGTVGPELHASSTLQGSCADGNAGTFHVDESLDRLVVSSLDGRPLTAGKQVKVSATVWVHSPSQNFLDLYVTSNANQPSWGLLGTLTPAPMSGQQTLEATYVLPAGGLQAVRGQFRYQGSAMACSTGVYDDHDDMALELDCPTWYADPDQDTWGDASIQQVSCTQPAGYVSNSQDNCPATYNPDGEDMDFDGVGDVCVTPKDCGDLIESNLELNWEAWSTGNAPTTRSVLGGSAPTRGTKALRFVTEAAYDFAVQFTVPDYTVMDVSGYEQLRFSVRGKNTTPNGWQGNFPVVVLRDSVGRTRSYTPNSQFLTKDGVTWVDVTIPLAGDATWSVAGDTVDLRTLWQVEIHADTWDSGFTLDVDAVSFEKSATVCR